MARMRVFAGPNGSGKTTLNEHLQGKFDYGFYLNPDDFFNDITQNGFLQLKHYDVTAEKFSWNQFYKSHPLVEKLKSDEAEVIEKNNILSFSCTPSVYLVSIVIDYVRHLLLDAEKTFSFETVFSHPSKVQLMEDAQQKGYKTYLYFVCANSPDINVLRVKQRTEEGGHGVPEEKIRSRYTRALENLPRGIRTSYRAYFFDNSGKTSTLIGEVTPNKNLKLHKFTVPPWFKTYVLPVFS